MTKAVGQEGKQARKPCDGVRFAFSGTGNDRPRFCLRGVEEQEGRKIADKDVEVVEK
jgi:hypothetical protein